MQQPVDPQRPLRAIVADDHFLVRAGVKAMLAHVGGLQVDHEAASAHDLLAAAARLQPDLVVTDYSMPDLDGAELLRALHKDVSGARIVVVSMHDEPEVVRRAVQAGAQAYVLKGSPPLELEQAVRAVMAGIAYFSPEVTQRLLTPSEPNAKDLLTERQIEILRRLAVGRSSKEIAFELGLSSKTIDAHRARIMERLAIRDAPGLALYCVRQGLIDPKDRRWLCAPAGR
jgi:two-component system, NarL family, nitrate/nitrite response regulator NarL